MHTLTYINLYRCRHTHAYQHVHVYLYLHWNCKLCLYLRPHLGSYYISSTKWCCWPAIRFVLYICKNIYTHTHACIYISVYGKWAWCRCTHTSMHTYIHTYIDTHSFFNACSLHTHTYAPWVFWTFLALALNLLPIVRSDSNWTELRLLGKTDTDTYGPDATECVEL